MVIRNMILKFVRKAIFPVLEGILDKQAEAVKSEVAGMSALSDEGEEIVMGVIDELITNIKGVFS